MKIRVALVVLAASYSVAAQPFVRAELQPEKERKAAPAFVLRDAAGKAANLKQYRGKVVLLDFWATWCTGCKQEIPWFVEFQKKFGAKRLAVVGVSLDEEGWKVLTPFLAAHPIPYRIVLGNEAMAHTYGIENMPDTFLIDKQGRVAAAYRAGLVDQADLQANLAALLGKK